MEHTFSFWRRKIIEFPKSIINVIKQYPSLRRPQQVNYFVHVYNYTASSLIKWLFLQILADLERVMGKSVKNTWDKIIPKILIASKLVNTSTYLSTMCDGEFLKGELHASN